MIPFQLDQYLEETAILFNRRVWLVEQPHVGLGNLLELDHRIDAQLDALIEGGESAWELSSEGMLTLQPGESFAAACLALNSRQSARLARLVVLVHGANELVGSIAMALAWRPWEEIAELAEEWLQAGSGQTAAGLAAHLIHGVDPRNHLRNAIDHSCQATRRIALRGVGELGRTDLLDCVAKHVADGDAESALWAAWSIGLLRGDVQDIERLKAIACSRVNLAAWFLPVIIGRQDSASTRNWLQQLVSAGAHRAVSGMALATGPSAAPAASAVPLTCAGHERLAIALAARMGSRDSIPWLLEKMSDPNTARIAAEAFTMVTGLRIQGGTWEVPCPGWVESGPTDDPHDENVEMDSDEYLPWPNVAAVTDWWRAHQKSFADGESYLLGRSRTEEWLWEVIRRGMQRERFHAALNLALQSPGRKLFNVCAPSGLQCVWLKASHSK